MTRVPQQGPQQDELKVWRCFHCDEVFTDKAEARAHFGEDQTGTTAMGQAACTIAASEGGLLKALRESEREVGALRHQAEQLEYDAQAYEMTTAELTQRFGVGVRTAYQAWLKLEAMESRAMAAEEQLAALSASRIDPASKEYIVAPTTAGGNETVVKDGIYMSRKPFSALRAQMSPESQARAAARTAEMSAELASRIDPAVPSPDGAVCMSSPTREHAFSEHEGARTRIGTGKACVWCGVHESSIAAAVVPSPSAPEPK